MLFLGSEFYPRRGEFTFKLLFLAFITNLANIAGVLYVGYNLGQFFFHKCDTRKVFENNTLENLWKSGVENNGDKCADVLPATLWHTKALPDNSKREEKNGSC